jgi:hypothetical protein
LARTPNAARLRRNFPALEVVAIAEPVERVPLGRLRADLIASGLDSLAARLVVNRVAWRLGVPWVDAGVRADGLLARVAVFEPAADAACFECALSARQRAALDNRYPCDPPAAPAPTGAPAWLGGLAASLQCAEGVKLLAGKTAGALVGREVLVDAATHRHQVSALPRAADCAFDHAHWSIRPLARRAGAISVSQALRLVPCPSGERAWLRVDGDTFVHRLECPACHASREVCALGGRLGAGRRACARCATRMVAPGMQTSDALTVDHLGGRHRRTSLHAMGLRAGDVFSVETSAGEALHFEIGGR